MLENSLILNNNSSKFIRLALVFGFVLFASIIFNVASWMIIFGIIFLTLGYILTRRFLWIWLALAIPALAFGHIAEMAITPNWTYEISLAEIFIFGSIIIFAVDKFINSEIKNIRIDSVLIILLMYIVLAVSSIFHLLDFHNFIGHFKTLIFSAASFFLAINLIDTRKKMNYLIYSLALTAALLSAQIFYKFYQMGFSSKFFFNRSEIAIPVGAIALVGAILAVILPVILAFYFSLHKGHKGKPFIFTAFVFGWLAIFMMLGKGAILSLLIALFYLFIKNKDKRKIMIMFFGVFAIVSLVLFSAYFGGLVERVKTITIDKNTTFRITEYKLGWDLIKKNPVIGVGVGQQPIYFQKIFGDFYQNLVNNYYLQSAIDLGMAGLLAIVSLTAVIAGKARKIFSAYGRDQMIIYGFTGAMLAAFMNGLVEVTFFALPYAIIFWSMLGGLFGFKQVLAQTNKNYLNTLDDEF